MDKLGKFLQRDLVNASPSRFLMDDVKENEMASSLPQNVTADYVRAIGSDGKSYRIPKADFASIIRSELGTILNGLSDQQTVTKVPTLNGATLGASAVATLASVLGEQNNLGFTRIIEGQTSGYRFYRVVTVANRSDIVRFIGRSNAENRQTNSTIVIGKNTHEGYKEHGHGANADSYFSYFYTSTPTASTLYVRIAGNGNVRVYFSSALTEFMEITSLPEDATQISLI